MLLTEDDRLVGYCRVLDEASSNTGPVWRIGRVVLGRQARGRGLADQLVRAAMEECAARDAARDIVLAAQSPLARWYATFGFVLDGEPFLEDGIPHTPMRLRRG